MIKFIYVGLLIVIGAIIAHICILFLIPYYTQDNIWARFKKPDNYYHFSNIEVSDPIHQFSDPLFLLNICKFNLDNGPVHFKALKTTQFWSLSVYKRNGIIFYNINDRTAPKATLDLIIGKPRQIIELKKSKSKNSSNTVLVTQNLNKGFAVLRVFVPSPIVKKESETFLSSATCQRFSRW
ncbi:DUF1254 domain-containing protein [Bartonella sp. B30(2025)]